MNQHLREEEFVPYLDGRLNAVEQQRLDQHLAACAACRAQLEELRVVMDVLGDWKGIEPSPGFAAALRARLAEETAAARQPWWALRPAYVGALAVAILLVVAVSLWQPAPGPPPPAGQTSTLPEVGPTSPEVARQSPERIPELAGLPPAAGDSLAVLDNQVLLEDYELLEEFDVLFEPVPEEKEKL